LKLKIWGVFIAVRLGNELIFNLKFFDKITQKNGQAHKKLSISYPSFCIQFSVVLPFFFMNDVISFNNKRTHFEQTPSISMINYFTLVIFFFFFFFQKCYQFPLVKDTWARKIHSFYKTLCYVIHFLTFWKLCFLIKSAVETKGSSRHHNFLDFVF
jgi:hypothetical protein